MHRHEDEIYPLPLQQYAHFFCRPCCCSYSTHSSQIKHAYVPALIRLLHQVKHVQQSHSSNNRCKMFSSAPRYLQVLLFLCYLQLPHHLAEAFLHLNSRYFPYKIIVTKNTNFTSIYPIKNAHFSQYFCTFWQLLWRRLNYYFSPANSIIIFHSDSVTGCTDNLPKRTNAISLKRVSAFTF